MKPDPGAGALLKTPDEWLAEPEYEGFTVLDPDGWDRQNFEASWAEKITREEFNRRLCESTVIAPLSARTEDVAGLVEELPDLLEQIDGPCTCGQLGGEIGCPYCNSMSAVRRKLERTAHALAAMQSRVDEAEAQTLRTITKLAKTAHERDAALAEVERLRGYTLPCDVAVPPATVIRKGCKLDTLILAMNRREGTDVSFTNNAIRAALSPKDQDE